MVELTKKQREVAEYLETALRRHGYWPSIREIQNHFGFASTNAVVGHLRALERKGILERQPGQARAFSFNGSRGARVREPESGTAIRVVSIPVLGDIAAGYPDRVESGGGVESLQIDVHTANYRRFNGAVFAIRVRGDSMINAGIENGDTVVVEDRPPRDGDIVAALIDGATTLKRFIANPGGRPYLKAENPDYPELYPAEELRIQGVAKAVVRRL